MTKYLRLAGLAAVLALVVPASALGWHQAFPRSNNIVPMGELASAPDRPANQFNSDFAFWRNYAFLGAYDRFRIVDISNPASPTLVSETMCGQSQGDVTISPDGNILVRSQDSPRVLPGNDQAQACNPGTPGNLSNGWEGLQIFDVSNKANPQFVKAVFTDFGSHTHTQYYDRANNRLIIYVSRGGTRMPSTGGYGVTPTNPYGGQNWPVENGCITAVEVPLAAPQNAQVVNRCIAAGSSPTVSGGCHDVMVYEGLKRLYGACRPNMILWDISDPVNPRPLHEQQYPNIAGWHSAGMSWDGKLLFAGWEPGGGSAPRCMATGTQLGSDPLVVQTDAMKTIFVFRASDGALVGRWVLPREQTSAENCTIHNYAMVPYVDRHIMVQGSYQSGSSVIDFTALDGTRDRTGRELAWVDPPPLTPTQLGGAWSTHWYNGFMYESDIPRGFAIYDVTESWWKTAINQQYLNPQTMTERLACRVTVSGTALRARRTGTLRASVRVNGQAVQGMNVRVRGLGVSRVAETNANGIASLRVRPRARGRLTISASELNVAACTATRRVAAAPRRARPPRGAGGGPALTGRPA